MKYAYNMHAQEEELRNQWLKQQWLLSCVTASASFELNAEYQTIAGRKKTGVDRYIYIYMLIYLYI